jgi:UDP-3-O-[3-hydroxymyristoyl] glucosamine N-acyltransferase
MIDSIYYDTKGVWVHGEFKEAKNPRLAFARELEKINDDSKMVFIHESWIRSNTVFEGRHKIGFGCVIGGNGFGYEREEDGKLTNIPHRGHVIMGKDVRIHNNVCIDRGVLSPTIIGEGTVIDNLIHIAHNVQIGKNCLIVAGTVIGGSCVIGANCFIGINASIKNKVRIGNNVTIGMSAVITKDVPDGVTVIGVNKIL